MKMLHFIVLVNELSLIPFLFLFLPYSNIMSLFILFPFLFFTLLRFYLLLEGSASGPTRNKNTWLKSDIHVFNDLYTLLINLYECDVLK